MSNERNETGMDPLVSKAYRELADEQTPDSLNRKVLRMAAGESKTRYSIARAWTRPVAWAATIGLSLVVVLRLTDVPPPDSADASSERGQPVEQNLVESETGHDQQNRQVPPPMKRSRPVMQQQETAEKAGARHEAPLANAESMHDAPTAIDLPADGRASSDDEVSAQSLAPRSAELLREADELARMQSGSARDSAGETTSTTAPVAAAASSATSVSSEKADTSRLCPASVRTSAEKWSECIAVLEKTAPRELIEREHEELLRRFPEFERSIPDR